MGFLNGFLAGDVHAKRVYSLANATLGVMRFRVFGREYDWSWPLAFARGGLRKRRDTLFRSAAGKTGTLTDKPMNRIDAYRMIRRRTAEAGLKGELGCPRIPCDRHYRLSRGRRHARKRAGNGRSRESAHHKALRPHRR